MARHQVNAASEHEAREGLALLPSLSAGEEVALCCSACGTVLERAVAPEQARAELFAIHICGAPRVEAESAVPVVIKKSRAAGGAAGVHGTGRPPDGETTP